MMSDFPKIECPFIRKLFKVDKKDFEKHGRELQLREPEVYLVTDEVNPSYEWVFDDPDTIAIEKLNGTNVKLKTENGRLIALQNRKNVIDPLEILKGKTFLVEGVFMAIQKGYVADNLEQAGEIIGPKLQGNPYKLDNHIWYPFSKAINHLRYKSFHDYPVTFENLNAWFKDHLKSLLHSKKVGYSEAVFAEGVIFYNLKRKAEGKTYMAKLRRDMFDWYYDSKIAILPGSSKDRFTVPVAEIQIGGPSD
jgi:hypothetical protein